MHRVIKTAGPIVLLLRLADMTATTLCKLKGTVDFITSKLVDSGSQSLEDNLAVAWNTRLPEFQSDDATAAWIIDPQFVSINQ